MALVERGVEAVTRRLPKVISPRTHAIIDYVSAGTFFLAGAVLWKKHRRAAIGALACGTMQTATSLLTDYPGGVTGAISFETHGKIDAGFAPLVGMMPTVLAFTDSRPANLFRLRALGLAAVTGLTDFDADTGTGRLRREWRKRTA